MMTLLRRVSLHVGRRGSFLVSFAVVYGLLGYSYLGVHVTPVVRHSLRVALTLAPLPVWAWAWIAAAVISGVCGLFCPGRKAAGFAAAVVMPALWAAVYAAGWLNGDIPRGWVTALLFAALATAVAVIAGMPEPRDLIGGRR
jgi:hypothetical protein